MRIKFLIPIALFFCLGLSFTGELFAQGKKKKNKSVAKTANPVSEKDRLEALSLFFDGEKAFILEDLETALTAFKKSVSIDPNNDAAHFKVGQILLNQGDYNEALVYVKNAKALNSDNEYYYQLEAEIYTGLGDFDTAAEIYEQILSKWGNRGEFLFELGARYLFSGNYEKALGAYQRAKEFYGPNDQITKQKQAIYLKQGQVDKAIEEGEELIEAFPDNIDYRLGLVEILLSGGEVQKTEILLEETKEDYPDNSKVYIMLSEIYRDKKNYLQAVESLFLPFQDASLNFSAKLNLLSSYMTLLPNDSLENSILELSRMLSSTHPDEIGGYSINGDINLNLGRRDSAIFYYKKALGLDKSNFNVWQNVIQLESELQLHDSVIFHANQAVEYFPNQAVFYYYLGSSNYMIGNYTEAVNAYQLGSKFSKKDPGLHSVFNGQLGDTYYKLSEYEKSYNAYEKALESNPDNDHVLNNYSYYLSLEKRDMEKALKMSTALVKNHPNNETYLDTHAWVLYVMGDYANALIYLEKAVAKTTNGTIIEHYGDVLFKLNKVDEAVKQWKKAKSTADELTEYIDKKIEDGKLYE